MYIREAHPTDGWQVASNLEEQVLFAQTATPTQRQEVATACRVGLRLSIPTLLDTPDNQADLAYNAWPERLYVLAPTGQVLYQGGKGPYHFDTEELAAFLAEYFS